MSIYKLSIFNYVKVCVLSLIVVLSTFSQGHADTDVDLWKFSNHARLQKVYNDKGVWEGAIHLKSDRTNSPINASYDLTKTMSENDSFNVYVKVYF